MTGTPTLLVGTAMREVAELAAALDAELLEVPVPEVRAGADGRVSAAYSDMAPKVNYTSGKLLHKPT